MLRGTINELAAKFNVEYPVMSGFLKMLEKFDVAKVVDTKKSSTGKGRSSTIWELPEKVEFELK